MSMSSGSRYTYSLIVKGWSGFFFFYSDPLYLLKPSRLCTRMTSPGWKALVATSGTLLKFSTQNTLMICATMWVSSFGCVGRNTPWCSLESRRQGLKWEQCHGPVISLALLKKPKLEKDAKKERERERGHFLAMLCISIKQPDAAVPCSSVGKWLQALPSSNYFRYIDTILNILNYFEYINEHIMFILWRTHSLG